MIYPTWSPSSGLGPDELTSDAYDPPLLPTIKGSSKVLVTENDIQIHLDLLSIFHKVHHAVQEGGVVVDPASDLPIISAAQTLFLARAQHRFGLWTDKILQRPGRDLGAYLISEEMPPIDVLMLLHSYMLHPLNYREDLIRVYPCLVGVGSFPLKAVSSLINRKKVELIPTAGQVELWESLTKTPFESPLNTLPTEKVDVACPQCLAINNVSWVNNKGTGAGQVLSSACGSCGLTVDRDALSVGKFLQDMVLPGILPYTIFNDKGFEDLESAQAISRIIKETLSISSATDGGRFNWTMVKVKMALFSFPDMVTLVGDYRIERLLSAYDDPAPSSFDIKPAVMRQARFINEMHEIQSAGEKSFSPGAFILNAIIRYHHFFLRSSEISIPSVDVDLAFHTHLLSADGFINDCRHILGRVLDHDDSVERKDIEQALSLTINIWQNIPYPISTHADDHPHCSSDPTCPHCGQKSGHSSTCPYNK